MSIASSQDPSERAGSARSEAVSSTTVAIIGAGFSGLCMAYHLTRKNVPFVIIEKENEVGGVWRDNVYPGAACDTQSHLYSFSFSRNPTWSRKFAEQPEILAYLKSCSAKHGTRQHIRFGVEVISATYDERAAGWVIELSDGKTLHTQFLVSAVGQLNRPATPNMPGLERFAGKVLHTARWDNSYDLTGKTVAVVGTGATTVQLVPRLVDRVKRLLVVQRSPNWVTTKSDREFTESELGWFRRIPLITALYRRWVYYKREITWPEFLTGSKAAKMAEADILEILDKTVKDPVLRKQLTPDYPIGCKRVLMSNDYYPALQRPNAGLVASGVARIEHDAIIDNEGNRHQVDVIAFATGFLATEFLMPMKITGKGGKDIHEAWKEGAEAYLGITTPGFPNFFMLYGPNTNLGHTSIVFMIECQVEYIIKCLAALRARKARTIEVTPSALKRFLAVLDGEMAKTAWVASCSSWYKVASGRIVNNWSTSTFAYWRRTRTPKLADYEIK